jgi:hypothetical protein
MEDKRLGQGRLASERSGESISLRMPILPDMHREIRPPSWLAVALWIYIVAVTACGNGPASPAPAEGVGINTAGGWSDSPFISGDGRRLYFMYSRYNFGPWILSGGAQPPVLAGPDRPGLHHSTQPWDESDIYVATKQPDGSWSEPVNLGRNGAFGDASGMEIDHGNTFVWLRGNGTTNKIVMSTRNQDGTWSTPLDLGAGINDHSPGVFQDNPHLSADGNALWFTSNRATGSHGGRDIWFSARAGSSWSNPVNVGAPINTTGDEDQFWFAPGTLDLYWNSASGLMHCISNGTACAAAPSIVTIAGCSIAAEASMTDDGQLLYFACGNLTTGRVSIMYARRQGAGWGAATPVD